MTIEEQGNKRKFDCYLCGITYTTFSKPCMHYDESEMDEHGEVSLCGNCAKKAMAKAKKENIKGLSTKFFNCK